MIFENKHLNHITDDEIDYLVTEHVAERQQLEYKRIFEYKNEDARIEFLKDITSLANGGGGYLIIGIRDDGKGRAEGYEPLSEKDLESMKKSIESLCLSYISERIDGLDVAIRKPKGNPILIVKVPFSFRIPHMVSKDRTDFYTRYRDGKRTMTIGEIREAFNKESINEKLKNFWDIRKNELDNNSKIIVMAAIPSNSKSILDDEDILDLKDRTFFYNIPSYPNAIYHLDDFMPDKFNSKGLTFENHHKDYCYNIFRNGYIEYVQFLERFDRFQGQYKHKNGYIPGKDTVSKFCNFLIFIKRV